MTGFTSIPQMRLRAQNPPTVESVGCPGPVTFSPAVRDMNPYPWKERDPDFDIEDRIQRAMENQSRSLNLSRADRRTAKGRVLVVENENAALRLENEILREALGLKSPRKP